MDDGKRRLIWHGVFLFLLGLFTGFVVPKFVNPRMGLAAHLEGVLNGIFLIAVGAVWNEVRLSGRLKPATFWIALYSAYVNWLANVLAASFGSASLTPIAAAGHSALALAGRTCDGAAHVGCNRSRRHGPAAALGAATQSRSNVMNLFRYTIGV